MIITFASILASLLVFLGIKKIPLKSKGVFGVMLSFFLFLNACNNKIDSKQGEKEDTKTVKTEQKNNNVSQETPKNKIDFAKEFKSKERWLKIKKIWKFLNKVEPKENGVYLETLTQEEQMKVKKDLVDTFGYNFYEIKKTNKATELEKVLYNLINERIGGLTLPREMMMRMVAPPSAQLKNKTIIEIEKEIDVLIKLRKDKKVSSKEVSKVLTRIQDNVYMSCILNVFKTSSFNINYNLNLSKATKLEKIDELIDLWIKEYESLYNKTVKNTDIPAQNLNKLEENHIKLQKDLENIKKLKPKINALIKALEAE
jgi:hypothetical protein